eukprot:TRINITY_DN1235_c1_g1_i1.p1 TRINITY_DN1235_c1_g1~~TRINITY_DN1235_c1_g1_i1.p1  ORF type:complete len:927 (+),score=247.50 TRINITY_DN1235_c1_g1_i1:62-2842(+)
MGAICGKQPKEPPQPQAPQPQPRSTQPTVVTPAAIELRERPARGDSKAPYKEGEIEVKFYRGFQARYVVLKDNTLKLYIPDEILVGDETATVDLAGRTYDDTVNLRNEFDNCLFEVDGGDRPYTLKASSERVRHEWAEAIRESIEYAANPGKRFSPSVDHDAIAEIEAAAERAATAKLATDRASADKLIADRAAADRVAADRAAAERAAEIAALDRAAEKAAADKAAAEKSAASRAASDRAAAIERAAHGERLAAEKAAERVAADRAAATERERVAAAERAQALERESHEKAAAERAAVAERQAAEEALQRAAAERARNLAAEQAARQKADEVQRSFEKAQAERKAAAERAAVERAAADRAAADRMAAEKAALDRAAALAQAAVDDEDSQLDALLALKQAAERAAAASLAEAARQQAQAKEAEEKYAESLRVRKQQAEEAARQKAAAKAAAERATADHAAAELAETQRLAAEHAAERQRLADKAATTRLAADRAAAEKAAEERLALEREQAAAERAAAAEKAAVAEKAAKERASQEAARQAAAEKALQRAAEITAAEEPFKTDPVTRAPIKDGLLTKQGGSWKNWKDRWFVLKDNVLSYYEPDNVEAGKELGVINLKEVTTDQITYGDERDHQFNIACLTAVKPRTYQICARNDPDRNHWVKALRASIDFFNAPASSHFQIGDYVEADSVVKGIIRFIGQTKFAAGDWLGVELEKGVGKNNGTVQGIRYFDCPEKHGLFLRPNRCKLIPAPADFATSDESPAKSPVPSTPTPAPVIATKSPTPSSPAIASPSAPVVVDSSPKPAPVTVTPAAPATPAAKAAPHKEGLLTKQGGVFKSWHERWFILKDNKVTYYEPGRLDEPLGDIDLNGMDVIDVSKGYLADRPHLLQLACKAPPRPRTYLLCAKDDEERDAWMVAFQSSIAHYTE